jgi:hypothetical protein
MYSWIVCEYKYECRGSVKLIANRVFYYYYIVVQCVFKAKVILILLSRIIQYFINNRKRKIYYKLVSIVNSWTLFEIVLWKNNKQTKK